MRKPSSSNVVTVGTKSFEELWAATAEACKESPPPPGSMTSRQFAAKFGIPHEVARNRLIRLTDAGKFTATRCKITVGGQLHSVTHYTPVA
jgi:hypothetical protein